MSDEQAAEAPQASKKRSFAPWLIVASLVLPLALVGWWYFAGDAGVSGLLSEGRASKVPETQATDAVGIDIQALETRLSALESATILLESARVEHEAAMASFGEFARKEDVRQSAALLREEIRAMRGSFPETLELEHSQAALALRLLELAEIEHRLFGDSKALAVLIARVQALLRDHPRALDVRVDIARLGEDIAAAKTLDKLELAVALRDLVQDAAKVPLGQSQFDIVAASSAGFLERLAASLGSLVRVRRLESPDEQRMVTRAPLLLGLERMQVALLRRKQAAFERERASAIDWIEQHAEMESALTRELLAALHALDGVRLGVQRDEFDSLMMRVGELIE
ncbi:MAG: hypothetical protein OXE81_12370 [Gammaproteobacteria bacterium]|nr:hypothetical protein [Gammaproteobacteria bacterium]